MIFDLFPTGLALSDARPMLTLLAHCAAAVTITNGRPPPPLLSILAEETRDALGREVFRLAALNGGPWAAALSQFNDLGDMKASMKEQTSSLLGRTQTTQVRAYPFWSSMKWTPLAEMAKVFCLLL